MCKFNKNWNIANKVLQNLNYSVIHMSSYTVKSIITRLYTRAKRIQIFEFTKYIIEKCNCDINYCLLVHAGYKNMTDISSGQPSKRLILISCFRFYSRWTVVGRFYLPILNKPRTVSLLTLTVKNILTCCLLCCLIHLCLESGMKTEF